MGFLLDQLKHKYHAVFMDNLYMPALFARRVMANEKRVKIHGVTRCEGRGIPSCIKQFPVKDEITLESI